ncbi:MAG: beta-lactamase family protein [Defluviitaleaceae bacterium]|nr:beta-lactamase family protein [Defluviitaleaceae bacterium]
MHKFLKKAVSLALASAMVLSSFSLVFANEAVYEEAPILFTDTFDFLSDTKTAALTQAYQAMETMDVSGLSFAVVHRDTNHTWTRGVGFADVENERGVTEDTLFDIGSVTKLFTAISIMQLVEQGVLDLDEPITTYLPDFSVLSHPVNGGDYRNITTRMLLAHVAGLPGDMFGGFGTIGAHYPAFMNNMLPRLAGVHMYNVETDRMAYSNVGYTVLGILVAEVSGFAADGDFFHGFANYIQENIFDPLDMASTTFFPNEDEVDVSLPYITASLPAADRVFANATSVGGLYSNAYDMARFMHMLLNFGELDGNRILSEAYFAQMVEVQDFDFSLSPMMQYALGFIYWTWIDGTSHMGHDGGWINYFTGLVLDFEHGIGVFGTTNSVSGASVSLQAPITMLADARYELEGIASPVGPLPEREPIELSLEALEVFTGYYVGLGHLRISEEGKLYFADTLGPDAHLEFTPYSDGSFDSILGRFWFKEIAGRMILMQGELGIIPGPERIDLWQADESLDRWIGDTWRYQTTVPNSIFNVPEATITVGVDEDGYAFLTSLAGSVRIGMIDEYTFYVLGTSRGLGGVIQFGIEEDGTKWLQGWGTRYVMDVESDLDA